jgi:dipeptidyl-peptidase-4
MDWASNSTELIVQQFNRRQNTNRMFLGDAATGQVRPVLTETDPAWVDNHNAARWMDRGQQFLWLSERDGWQHAYRVSRDGRQVTCISRGAFDVLSLDGVDERHGWLYFSASPDNPTQRYLYRTRLAGGKPQRLTPANQPGTHTYQLSPDARWAIHTWSSFTRPPLTELIRLPDHTTIRLLEDNHTLRAKLETLDKPLTEFFRVTITNNVSLDGWCLKPPSFDPAKRYPVLFYVYGEPGAQTVLDAWRERTQLWHWMLAQQGYVVMSVDNRGTPAPRGRAWRKSIYRQLGLLNAADQAAAVRALLRSRPYLDPSRVGVWGWSGGGDSTLNAMLQYPDLYHTGIAVAAIANQRHYDAIYEERYMDLPENNPDGYRLGSPLTYAVQLKGNLLIVHGTGDDNVHYQGAETLINELIYYDKRFTMMAYPNRSHAINEGKNTTRHLYELFTRYLEEHLRGSAPN